MPYEPGMVASDVVAHEGFNVDEARAIVVMVNSRQAADDTPLHDGDVVELVTQMVGGGSQNGHTQMLSECTAAIPSENVPDPKEERAEPRDKNASTCQSGTDPCQILRKRKRTRTHVLLSAARILKRLRYRSSVAGQPGSDG